MAQQVKTLWNCKDAAGKTILTDQKADTVGKTCRVVRTPWTEHFEQHPAELQPFPAQAVASMRAGVNHLGAPDGTEVDRVREFMPCGQGVGAIDTLVPAGDLVRSIVAEAERVIDAVSRVCR